LDICLHTLSVSRREQSSENECGLQGTDNVRGKISEHVFATNGGYGVHYPSNIFATGGIFSKLGNITWIFPSFSWDIFDHVTQLDKLHPSANI